jgi:L-lysine 6-oxidase
MQYEIEPKIGVARVGNSPSEFYIGPEIVGGLPIACDAFGNPLAGNPPPERFKDAAGAIKRQAARFHIVAHDGAGQRHPVEIPGSEVCAVRWTVHLANKKPVWYAFQELKGDLLFGPENSYTAQKVPLRNAGVSGPDRQRLMTDPGPRSLSQPATRTSLSRDLVPHGYPGTFPPRSLQPPINSIGDLIMDSSSRLLVLGGYGTATGSTSLDSFRGGDGWFDDVSDGYVLATLTLADGCTVDLEPAWVIVGSPKYAPEIVNIVTLDDCVFDTAVRHLQYDPTLYDPQRFANPVIEPSAYDPCEGFNPDYEPNFERDIEPIITRPRLYRWVANVPSVVSFAYPPFDPRDASPATAVQRREYFECYRVPVPPERYAHFHTVENGPTALFGKNGLPMLPLNSGDNSVSNYLLYKFLTLTPTHYFFLRQWSLGKFTSGPVPGDGAKGVSPIDRSVLGNCVGGPFCPGIEVPWLMRNPAIYSAPFRIRIRHWTGSNDELIAYYASHGLSTTTDPDDGQGAEPGDLTKRMATPWQADFFDCSYETPNIANASINQAAADDGIQIPPAYYVYWWPPQSPMHVIAGSLEPGEQVLDGFVTYPAVQRPDITGVYQINTNYQLVSAGQQVPFTRGANSYGQLVSTWADFGFIVNKGNDVYPYLIETERNTLFVAQGTALGTK